MDDGPASDEYHLQTRSVKHGEEPQPASGPGDAVSPIHLATTFAMDEVREDRGWTDYEPTDDEYFYTRLENPTRYALEQRLASLHDAEHAYAFASGMAAISATVMATVEPGDHVVAFDQVYSGTNALLRDLYGDRLDVDVSFVDATDTDAVVDAVRSETELVWMETPTNPRMKLCDVAALADVAADNDATLGVDNTFLSPYFQRPLELGADVVVDATTKYLNGHTDSTGGSVATDDDALAERLAELQGVTFGSALPPFDCYLVLRGLKTFPLRMREHERNARRVAERLDAHPAVDAVHYPGLESHPQHDLAEAQTSGHGGILSADLDATYPEAVAFMKELDTFQLAVSVGGVESLIQHPASMTHSTIPREEREALGITDSLVRLSVGVEHVGDLLADLDAALDALAES